MPILVFFISYSAVYAYFTARSSNQIQTVSATVKIGFKDIATSQKTSYEVKTNNVTSASTTIMPGDTLVTHSTVQNEGNVDVYSVFRYVITIEKQDGSTEIDVDDYYTYTTDGTITKLKATNGVYTDAACKLEPNQTVNLVIEKYYKGSLYGNEYKKAKITYTITALAIQTSGIGTAANATNIMINNQTGTTKNLQVFGNTQVVGTPDIDNPATIQSVGERTINVLDHIKSSSTISGITFTVNSNKSITLNGTSTGDIVTAISEDNGFLADDTSVYTICGCLGGSLDTYYIQSQNGFRDTGNGVKVSAPVDKNRIRLYIKSGVTLNNVTIYPMLIKGDYVGKVPEYEPYGYKVETNVTAKIKDSSAIESYMGYINETNNLLYGGDGNITYLIPCKRNTTYTFNHNNDNNQIFRIGYINIDKSELPTTVQTPVPTYQAFRGTTEKSLNIQTGSDAKYIVLQIQYAQNETTIETLKMQYTENFYLDQPLRKVGDYADYIDFATGTVVRNVRSLEFLVVEMNNNKEYPGWVGTDQTNLVKKDFGSVNLYLNILTYYVTNIGEANKGVGINTKNSGGLFLLQTYFGLYQEDWLADKPDLVVNVCYGMPKPEVEAIELPNLLDFKLESVSVNSSLKPSLVINLQ